VNLLGEFTFVVGLSENQFLPSRVLSRQLDSLPEVATNRPPQILAMQDKTDNSLHAPDQLQAPTAEERRAARLLRKKQKKEAQKQADLLDKGLQQRRKEISEAGKRAKRASNKTESC